jgi:hypothetical protein
LVAVLGGSQKLAHWGSKRPAPGTTMSTEGKLPTALVQRALRSTHEVTSVFWKMRDGLPAVGG